MPQKTKILFLYLFCLSPTFYANSFAKTEIIKWGDIPQADLFMEKCAKDTNANAYILGDIGSMRVYLTSNGYEYSLTRHKRIKIFNKNGFEYADVSLPFYSRDGIEVISDVVAQIISPTGEKYQLHKREIFKESINENWSRVSFTFPGVKEGSVIEYAYTLRSKNIVQLDTWFFHNEIPTRYSLLKLHIVPPFSYITLFEGAEEMDQEVREDMTILRSGDTEMRIKPGYYLMQDAPAFKNEAYITNIDDYRARIRFQLQEAKFVDGTEKTYLSTWEEVAADFVKDREFGQQYAKKKNFKNILEAINPVLTGVKEEKEKVKKIYDFLADKMEWNGKYGIYAKRNLDEAFEKKLGSGVEINLMMVALLNHFGIEAYPIMTATRSFGKMIPDYSIISQFNHIMVLLITEKGSKIVDIPSKVRPLGLPDVNSLNYFGWVVRLKPEWISINAPVGTDAFHTKIEFGEDGVRGKMTARFNNYNAISERESYRSDSQGDYWNDRLSKKIPEVAINSFEVKNDIDITRPFTNIMDFSAEEIALQAGDFIYLSPILYSNFNENPFKQDERYYPVDFPYPFEEIYSTTIIMPKGYTVEDIPEAVQFKVGEQAAFFNYKVEVRDDVLLLTSQLRIIQLKIQPKDYPALKKMFDIMLDKHTEQIVLRKEN